ncbi:unnamed protein product, partial [Polarella glacialis]
VLGITLESEETLRTKLANQPKNASVHLNLMQWHLKWGELSKAMDVLKLAIEAIPEHGWQFQEQLGDLQWKYAKDQHAAEARYREALKGNPLAKRALFHFGMLQVWRGRQEEAERLFQGAVQAGMLRDTLQRPLNVLDRSLPARGLWDEELLALPAVSGTVEQLRENLPVIWAEYLKWNRTRAQDAEADKEGLVDPHASGRWLHFWVYHPRFERGVWNAACHYKTPQLCKLLKEINNTAGGIRILRADFDVLEPGAKVRPHCHPTNQELLLDLCLRAPRQGVSLVRSGKEERSWAAGAIQVLDPSYEHQELNQGKSGQTDSGMPDVDYSLELRHFYEEQGKLDEKSSEIPSILEKWKGREEKMIRELRKKYSGDRGERILLRLLIRHPGLKPTRTKDKTNSQTSSRGVPEPGGRGGLTVHESADEL